MSLKLFKLFFPGSGAHCRRRIGDRGARAICRSHWFTAGTRAL